MSGPYAEYDKDQIENIVNINILHVAYGARVLLPQMVARKEQTGKKSAMIITSSGLGSKPIPGFLAYSATKSFANFLA